MPPPAFLSPASRPPQIRAKEPPRPLDRDAQALLEAFRSPPSPAGEAEVPRLRVNEVVSTFANIYEKLRNAVEYHEEHLLRKNATERILKRRLRFGFGPTPEPHQMARLLIAELIRAGYLPNNAIPETKLGEVAVIVERALSLEQRSRQTITGDDARGLLEWITAILAADIEECLSPATRAEAMVRFAYRVVRQDVRWRGVDLNERERDLQLYLAVHRALVRSDQAMIRQRLFHLYLPEWRTADAETIQTIAQRLGTIRRAVEAQVNHPLAEPLLRAVKRYATAFLILKDVIEESDDPASRLTNPDELATAVQRQAERRYQTVGAKITRIAFRTILYIFLTKTILAILVEYPYELFVVRSVDYLPLAINIAFHPLFLLLIAISARVPGGGNTQRLTDLIKGLLYQPHQRHLPLEIRRHRGGFLRAVFRLIYSFMYLVSFGLIIWVLQRLGFNFLSTLIFLLFLSVVSFFGIRIRQQIRELSVTTEPENIFSTTFDLFTLPLIQVGRWLSLKAPRINLFIYLLDFIIEAPFKTIIEVVEDWFSFLREKKEEVY